ncbi:MAG: hypothetical protein ICV53_00185 [Flavisolibacter sp.]|nr:hypothetical protein [Flavisolibacter sp.]
MEGSNPCASQVDDKPILTAVWYYVSSKRLSGSTKQEWFFFDILIGGAAIEHQTAGTLGKGEQIFVIAYLLQHQQHFLLFNAVIVKARFVWVHNV